MANIDSSLVKKNRRERGTHGGREQTVTGVFQLADGASIPTSDVLRVALLGENVRPVRLAAWVVPVDGEPTVTAAFNIGVAPHGEETFKRPTGEEFEQLAEDPDALATGVTVPSNGSVTETDLTFPAGRYAPFILTATPTAAVTAAGGSAELHIAVTFMAEQVANGFVYEEFVNQKVANEA